MHKDVRMFVRGIRDRFPECFRGMDVLDCGSLDINGNNREFFYGCRYTGIDIVNGRNVDVVTKVHEFSPGKSYDVVISTEMLEHDCNYELSLWNMFGLLKTGGLLLITAAGEGRAEHGTTDCHPKDSPLTHGYYKNVSPEMLMSSLNHKNFSWYEISYVNTDIRFAGIKR